MKRILSVLIGICFFIGLAAVFSPVQAAECTDPLGVVNIKPGEPIHLAYWFVVAGPDASLGTDTMRGVEIAIDDVGGKVLDHPIKLTGEDTGCGPEGGQAAATKIASDPTVVAAIGSNC